MEIFVNANAVEWAGPPVGGAALDFHRALDGYRPSPLTELPTLADQLGVGRLFVKDESERLGLPAFKILGASWAVVTAVSRELGLDPATQTIESLRASLAAPRIGVERRLTLVTATDGNHGRAVSRMARLLGLEARVYVPPGLTDSALDGIRGEGAELHELSLPYDDVVATAAASVGEGELLVQDTAWEGYEQVPAWIIEGYDTLFAEIDAQLADQGVTAGLVVVPSGVGSLLQAAVLHYRGSGSRARVLCVEPATAACALESLRAGHPVTVPAEAPTIMKGLNCGTVSRIAWPVLREGLDAALTVTDDEARDAVKTLNALGVPSGPCGASTLAALRRLAEDSDARALLGVDADATVVLVSTESIAANPL